MKKLGRLISMILVSVFLLTSLFGVIAFAEDNTITISGFNGDATCIEKGTSMILVASGVTQGKSVTWSVTELDGSETDLATIEQTSTLACILTASKNSYGTVKVAAIQNDASGKKGEQIIRITSENLVTVDDKDSSIKYVNSESGVVWEENDDSGYYLGTGKCVIPPEDGSYSSSDPAYVEFTFTGTGIQWIGESNYFCGVAEVYVDGEKVSTIDPFIAPSIISQFVNFSREGLPYGEHTIRIVATGLKNAASTQYPGTRVLVDAFRYLTEAPLVDKSELQALISVAQSLNESDYTEETWDNLQTELVAAIATIDDTEATQIEVDTARDNLQAAIDALISARPIVILAGKNNVRPGSDFTIEMSLHNVPQGLHAEDITLNFDPAVFDYDPSTTTAEYVSMPSEGTLNIVVANIGGVSDDIISIANVGFKVKDGINNVSSIISVTNAELGIAPEGTVINAELSSITIKVGDDAPSVNKDILKATIEEAQSKYDSAVVGIDDGCYWQADKDILQSAIAEANVVYNDSSASQAEVDNATGALNAAIAAFEASVINPLTGDVDDSSIIDVVDLATVAYFYGIDSSSENWGTAAIADINKDGKIDIVDLAFIASRM